PEANERPSTQLEQVDVPPGCRGCPGYLVVQSLGPIRLTEPVEHVRESDLQLGVFRGVLQSDLVRLARTGEVGSATVLERPCKERMRPIGVWVVANDTHRDLAAATTAWQESKGAFHYVTLTG